MKKSDVNEIARLIYDQCMNEAVEKDPEIASRRRFLDGKIAALYNLGLISYEEYDAYNCL